MAKDTAETPGGADTAWLEAKFMRKTKLTALPEEIAVPLPVTSPALVTSCDPAFSEVHLSGNGVDDGTYKIHD